LDTADENIFEQFNLDLIGVGLFLFVIFYLMVMTLLNQAIRMILLAKNQVTKAEKID
jgi:hypothetical protein